MGCCPNLLHGCLLSCRYYLAFWHSNVAWVKGAIKNNWKLLLKSPTMFNNSMVISASLLLDSFIAFEWYESSCFSSYVVVNTSLGPIFPTMATWLNGQIPKTLNLDFMFSFFKDCCKAFSTHVASVVLFKRIIFRHGKIFLFSKRCPEWFEVGDIQWLQHMWNMNN